MNNADATGLERALQLGTQMLDAASRHDWTSVAALRPECDALIRQGDLTDDYAHEVLPELQRQHQSLLQMAGVAREAVVGELGRHQQVHRALSAYLDLNEKA